MKYPLFIQRFDDGEYGLGIEAKKPTIMKLGKCPGHDVSFTPERLTKAFRDLTSLIEWEEK